MIFGNTIYTFTVKTFEEVQEILDAINKDPSSRLIREEKLTSDQGFLNLTVDVFMLPDKAGETVVKMFPGLEKVLFPLSWKEKNKQ